MAIVSQEDCRTGVDVDNLSPDGTARVFLQQFVPEIKTSFLKLLNDNERDANSSRNDFNKALREAEYRYDSHIVNHEKLVDIWKSKQKEFEKKWSEFVKILRSLFSDILVTFRLESGIGWHQESYGRAHAEGV